MVIKLHAEAEFLPRYLAEAPAALALERACECRLLARQRFVAPVLDVGCGDGIFASVLFDDPVDLGIDINRDEVELARATGKYRRLEVCPGDRIPVADASFQTVFSNSVLEHIPDLVPVVREIHRVLAGNGVVYLTLPTDRFAEGAIGYRLLGAVGLRKFQPQFERFYNRFWRHYNYRSEAGWRDFFRQHGFETEEIKLYASKHSCTLNDALAYAALPSFVAKKLLNRWFFLPGLRRALAPALAKLYGAEFAAEAGRLGFGLVFLKLTKRSG